MGCFSFECKECGKGVNSTSFEGEMVKLFLLKDGKVIQEMEGEYDSYGRVFADWTQRKDVVRPLRNAIHWKDPTPEIPLEDYWKKEGIDNPDNHGYWLRVCDLMHSSNKSNGIAAIHSKCFKTIPATRSEQDPNQGWGKIKKKHMNKGQK